MLATVLAVLSMTSCEDWKFLDEHPKKIDATTYMSDAEEVQSVINSIYGQFERDAAFGRYLSVLPEALSDYAYGRGNYNTSYETGLTTNGQTFVKDSWAVLYRAIRFSNEIMSQIDGADLSQTDYRRGALPEGVRIFIPREVLGSRAVLRRKQYVGFQQAENSRRDHLAICRGRGDLCRSKPSGKRVGGRASDKIFSVDLERRGFDVP